MKRGPDRGFFPEPAKSLFILDSPMQEEAAKREFYGGANTVGQAQGGNGRTVNGAIRLVDKPGQVEVLAKSRADVSAHGFWKRETTTMFDIRIVNLNTGS